MVPANRIGYAGGMSLAQLKITQEVITLARVRAVRAALHGSAARSSISWAALCLVGAVYFVFRSA